MDRLLFAIKRLLPRKLFRFLQPIYHFLLAWLSALVYGRPSDELIVIGVTGTTGKTTVVYLIAKILENLGLKAGYTSTAILNDGKKEWLNDKKMTMIGRFFTQRILRRMVKNGCQAAIVETTSEGVAQYRHRFINYDILLITGLYPEHIDSHGNFENYKKAKGNLFKHLKNTEVKFIGDDFKVNRSASGVKKLDLKRVKKTIIANGDDEHKDYFLNFWAEQKVIYSGKSQPESKAKLIRFSELKMEKQGLRFQALGTEFQTRLLGEFNVYNALSAIAVADTMGFAPEKIQPALRRISGVPGRFEKIESGQDFVVIVDYAFEPNALSKLYETLKLLEHQKIIHILGSAGGGRDIARRPILGEIAGRNAQYVIVTDEDPYNEDPMTIISQVAMGAEKAGKKNNQDLFKILDRREAIKKGFSLASKNDIVLITGKGSEQAICRPNGELEPWDDRAVARGLLEEVKANKTNA